VISARMLADSTSKSGIRLVTLEVTFPRFILAEFNTHRVFSRNSASSRAIPVAKQLAAVREDPFIPEAFPMNQSGMSASEYVTEENDPSRYADLVYQWREACDSAMHAAVNLSIAGVHKQIANRVLEPWMWHTVIVSSTEWFNFFDLRISKYAQPEMEKTAIAMKAAVDGSTPEEVSPGDWHMPLITKEDVAELSLDDLLRASVARCAAVTYNRHLEHDMEKERLRFMTLLNNKHLSPFEHVATPSAWPGMAGGNFSGWRQLRWYVERNLSPEKWGS